VFTCALSVGAPVNCGRSSQLNSIRAAWCDVCMQVALHQSGAHTSESAPPDKRGVAQQYRKEVDHACRAGAKPSACYLNLRRAYGDAEDLPTLAQLQTRKSSTTRQARALLPLRFNARGRSRYAVGLQALYTHIHN
jgi:hypothetical protein